MALKTTKRYYTKEEIIDGIKGSDEAVLSYLYQKFLPDLKRMLADMGGKQKEAEEVFQESMMVIFLKLKEPHFEIPPQFDTFLYTVCKQQFLYRNRKNPKKPTGNFESLVVNLEDSLEQALHKAELFRFYKNYINQLDRNCAEILKGLLQGWDNAKIGSALNLPETYIAQQKLLCKQALKEAIRKKP